MKLIVFSDSHGRSSGMINAVSDEKPDIMLFLGDGLRDLSEVRAVYPELTIRAVCGNCDFGAFEAERDEFVICDKRIIMTHGHKYGVKTGYASIVNMACCADADILLFGHTHSAFSVEISGLLVANPGSVGFGGDYGVITINGDRIEYEAKRI